MHNSHGRGKPCKQQRNIALKFQRRSLKCSLAMQHWVPMQKRSKHSWNHQNISFSNSMQCRSVTLCYLGKEYFYFWCYIYTTYRLPRTVTQRMPTCVDASTCSSIFWRNSIVCRYLPLTFCGRPAAFAVARRTFCGQLPSCATTASRPHSRKVSFKDSSCSAMAYPQTTVSRHVCLTNSMQLPKASQSILCLIHCHYCSGVSTDTPLPLRIKTLCNISLETLSFILSAQTNA